MAGLFGMYPRPGFRRGSGTRGVVDTLRMWLRFPRSSPEEDAEALLRGEPFVVTAVRRTQEDWQFGYLYMRLSTEPQLWWESRHGDTSQVAAPVAIRLVRRAEGKERRRVKGLHFRIIEFSDRAADCQLAVPTGDVPLVKEALAELTRRRGGP
jgi:hypothetical protein